jgi:hypothetical protein
MMIAEGIIILLGIYIFVTGRVTISEQSIRGMGARWIGLLMILWPTVIKVLIVWTLGGVGVGWIWYPASYAVFAVCLIVLIFVYSRHTRTR